MKQVLQDLKTGRIEVADVPCPALPRGHLLIRTRASLISSGSERSIVEFAQSSWIARARSQPDKVRRVLDKIHSDGLLPTLEAVFARLDEPLPLGYCNAGVVEEAGAGVEGFRHGDRVASNGPHAEIVCVPRNLCARIPVGLTDDDAAFAVLGSISLHGARLLEPTLGESVAVVGLGLVGLMAVQILRAHGCRVLGIDPGAARRDLARAFGAEAVQAPPPEGDPVAAGRAFSSERGIDAVLITASSPGNEIIRDAARMCRKRGRIVLVGVVGLDLNRADFYEKELSFRVSCSYGPGRYDPDYEAGGRDYPPAYVRWTEQRNLEAILAMLADGRLNVASLISTRVPQREAPRAYETLTSDRRALGILLEYPAPGAPLDRVIASSAAPARPSGTGEVTVGVIGAGDFARTVLLPALRRTGATLDTIASLRGVSAAQAGRRFGFRQVASDHRAVLENPGINTIFIVTRHDSHARLAVEALQAGKHVFVEKPLALNRGELDTVIRAYESAGRHLMVGFNRRFSPHICEIVRLMRARAGPAAFIMTVNAGTLPAEHWLVDPQQGGGRIVGEAVHWIDLLIFLTGQRVTSVVSVPLGSGSAAHRDGTTLTLAFADGSTGTIHYLTNGSRRFPKERLEVAFDGRILHLDNYRALTGYGVPGFSRRRTWRQDKGHRGEIETFVKTIARGGAPLIPFADIEHATLVSFCAVDSARSGDVVRVGA
jgi:predicted dehydrogenase